ncbi:12620_t:CDS:2, partial [Entrophospora sp. SA101]
KFIGITVDNDDVDFGEKQDPRYVTYMDNKELIEKIKQVFNNI